MLIQVMKSKIHRVTVTEADLNYVGSITIDSELMRAAGIVEGERVFIVDINNGERSPTLRRSSKLSAPLNAGSVSGK